MVGGGLTQDARLAFTVRSKLICEFGWKAGYNRLASSEELAFIFGFK